MVDQCKDILRNGIKNKQVKYSYKEKKEYEKLVLFTSDYHEQDTHHNAELEAIWKKIPIRAAFNKSNFEIEKHDFWNSQEKYSTAKEIDFHYSQIADDTVVEAWSKCMADTNKGFYSIVEKVSDEIFGIKLLFKHENQLTLKHIKILDAENLELKGNSELPDSINSGETAQKIFFKKQDITKDSFVLIEGIYRVNFDKYVVQINQFIPGKIVPDYYKIALENLFDIGNNPINISWGPHWRDSNDGKRGSFQIKSKKLRINMSGSSKWNFYQEFDISDAVYYHHVEPSALGQGAISIPDCIGTVTASFSLINNVVRFDQRPEFNSPQSNLLNDGIDQIVNYIWCKNKSVINEPNCFG